LQISHTALGLSLPVLRPSGYAMVWHAMLLWLEWWLDHQILLELVP
jgi:hypothetical protein